MATRYIRPWLVLTGVVLLSACAPRGGDGSTRPTAASAPRQAQAQTVSVLPPLTPAAAADRDPTRKFGRRQPPQPVPNELLVKFRAGTPTSELINSIHKMSVTAVRGFATVPWLRKVTLAPGVSAADAAAAWRADPDVEYVEPNYRFRKAAVPNDPRYGEQWALKNSGVPSGRTGFDIGAETAWDLTTGGTDVVVAVIDTGVDYNHEDLAANIYRNVADCNTNGVDDDGNGYVDDCHGIDTASHDSDPMDEDGHGTHVSGIIAAAGNNSVGISGVAWNSKVLPCRFIGDNGEGNTADAIECLDYVAALKARGVNIVATNNSWGGGDDSRALRDAIDAQLERGILFVTAAGNDGQQSDDSFYYPTGEFLPCAYRQSNIICVGATNRNGDPAYFSNFGRNTVHIYAPGVEILSTLPGNQYGLLDGTSMATPYVTGVIALLKSAVPARDWRALRNLVLASGTRPALDQLQRAIDYENVSATTLNAARALACTSPPINRRLLPRATGMQFYDAPLNGPQRLEVLSISCANPSGTTQTVVVNPGGVSVTLKDDGTGLDRVANDGVFAGSWTPAARGDYTLDFPGLTIGYQGLVDDNITAHVIGTKPGYPRRMLRFFENGAIQPVKGYPILVTNLDDTPDLEIVATGNSIGPTYAWKPNGTDLPGWPAWESGSPAVGGAAMLAAGNLVGSSPGFPDPIELVAGYSGVPGSIEVLTAGGTLQFLPRAAANYIIKPPVLVDFDGDGRDELLTSESDYTIHGYGYGAPLPGFPAYFTSNSQGQTAESPLVADLDNDGRPEFTSTSSNSAGGVLVAWHADGKPARGFPVETPFELQPVGAGDVDGDGSLDLVFLTHDAGWVGYVNVYAGNGTLAHTWPIPNTQQGFGASAVLADMNQDGIPEIVVASRDLNHPPYRLAVYDGTGNLLPGWPAQLDLLPSAGVTQYLGSGMAVGDLDGDRKPDVFLVSGSEMYLVRNDGSIAPGFPLTNGDKLNDLLTPAIADLDGDGRNEVIVHSDAWQGDWGFYRELFVYDFGIGTTHGPVEWGMAHGDARRTSNYRTGKNLVNEAYLATQAQGPGKIVSAPAGIDCGTSCLHRYAKGTSVTLTASADPGENFFGWRGACSGQTATCTVTVNDLVSVAASFRSQTLTANVVGSGTITSSPAGLNCADSCAHPVALDSLLVLTANPAKDWEFVSWSGACDGASTCTVTLDSAKSVTATFRLMPVVHVVFAGTGHATVHSLPVNLNCTASCDGHFATNSTVRFPSPIDWDSEFVSWTGCDDTRDDCTITMNGERTVTLNVNLKPLLTITRSGTGSGRVTSDPSNIDCGAACSGYFFTNTAVTLTVVASANSRFDGWTGACTGTQLTCTVTMDVAKSVGVAYTRTSTGGSSSSSGGKGGGGGGSIDLALLACLSGLLLYRRRRGALSS